MRRVFLSAGEASGDAYAAALISRLSGFRFEGVGGPRMAATGARMVADSSQWGALGIVEAFRVGPRVLGGYLRARAALLAGEPGLFVPIDFGFVNVKLARWAKRCGWKVLYFIPPGSWRRDRQGGDLPRIADEIVTPFRWSAELLRAAGASAHWFGHPLKQMVAERRQGVEDRREGVAVLPGSRAHEIAHNLEAIGPALAGQAGPVEFAVAPTADAEEIRRAAKAAGMDLESCRFAQGDAHGALLRARAAVVCSGTATLEAALCGCPCVVVYRGSKWMELEYRIRRPRFDFISLPNILLGRGLLPELIQWDATPDRIHGLLAPLLDEGPEREAQLKGFADLDEELGPATALDATAELARRMV